MGGDPFRYVVRYQKDVQRALDKLRQKVFRSGDYDGAGDGATTPDEALGNASVDGTRSILDIQFLSTHPELGCASELTPKDLLRHFGTTTPTLAQVEASTTFWGEIDRGTARYVVVHAGGRPTKLFFAGYSLD